MPAPPQVIRFLQLPFQFDSDRLQSDLRLILDSNWIPHFNTEGYSGDWKVISLYAIGGEADNIFAHAADGSAVSETALLSNCQYLKQVINTFECPILSARILRLGIGSEIKPHKDHELGYEDGNFRIHIPIITNPDVQFILDDAELTMLPGECWYTNVNFTHSVANRGDCDRFHLVIDGERNEWSDRLFFSLAAEENFFPAPVQEESSETVRRMIEELKSHNNPAMEGLIAELTGRLNDSDNQ